MTRLKWWFRIVGGFYLLLAIMNMYGMFVDQAFFTSNLPYGPEAATAFIVGWSPFAFEVLGLGTFMLWAARDPGKYVAAVGLIVWLELLHGVVDDLYLIAHGFSAGSYVPFIIVHFIIIGTGIAAVRGLAEQVPARVPATAQA